MTIIYDNGTVKAKSTIDAAVECCTALKHLFDKEELRGEARFRILCGILFEQEQVIKINNDDKLGDNVDILLDTSYKGIELIKDYIDKYKGEEDED